MPNRYFLVTCVAISFHIFCLFADDVFAQTGPENGIITSVEQQIFRETAAAHGVRLAFNRFAEALKLRNEKVASSLVTHETLDLYERCRMLALDSSGVDFGERTHFEVLLVFQLRYLLSREKLSAMKATDVFEWGVREGLVKQDVVDGVTLNAIQPDGDVAFATLYKDGQPVEGEAFRFVRENRQWKLDLLYITRQVEPVLEEVCQRTGKSKIELAVFLLERTYERRIPAEILNGPLN